MALKILLLVSVVIRIFAIDLYAESDVPQKPSINPPYIFGVRPKSPFLFRVPVSGTRPVKVKVENLPEGLTVDASNGIITGTILSSEKKTYTLTINVENSQGQDSHPFRIVVGDRICLTPPMGWNSWYVWSESLNEQHFREAADDFEKTGLIHYGWSYINMDDCWQGTRGGAYHALQFNEKFTDIKKAVDYVHAKGLKAGLYSVPSIGSYAGFPGSSSDNPEGNYNGLPLDKRLQPSQVFGRVPQFRSFGAHKVGAYWFFDKDIKQFADWGFDYIKMDWHPIDVPTVKRISSAVRAQSRDIVLSLSNKGSISNAAEYATYAELWRTGRDIHDTWGAIKEIGFAQSMWRQFAGPGHWNDPDMLQVGYTNTPNQIAKGSRPSRLTYSEQQLQVSLWCLLSSPLIISCDLKKMDKPTLELLTNKEALEINQDPLGRQAKELDPEGDLRFFKKELEDGTFAIGVFNIGELDIKKQISVRNIFNLEDSSLKDVWASKHVVLNDGQLELNLPKHSCLLLKTQKTKSKNGG